MTIGFKTSYKHLPKFSRFVETHFKCIDISKTVVPVDYIFSAPNYNNCLVDNKVCEEAMTNKVITPSTGTNHITANSAEITSIKNDHILREITSTAEHNLYLILSLVRNIEPLRQLSDLQLGILGYGRLGQMIEERTEHLYKAVKCKDLDFEDPGFFEDTDILTINIDLRPDNVELINKEYLSKFKKPIFIVNTSRGEVVNENDIIDGLWNRTILGYATDVIQEEHTSKTTIFKVEKHKNLLITPHTGGTAVEAQEKAYRRVIEKIKL